MALVCLFRHASAFTFRISVVGGTAPKLHEFLAKFHGALYRGCSLRFLSPSNHLPIILQSGSLSLAHINDNSGPRHVLRHPYFRHVSAHLKLRITHCSSKHRLEAIRPPGLSQPYCSRLYNRIYSSMHQFRTLATSTSSSSSSIRYAGELDHVIKSSINPDSVFFSQCPSSSPAPEKTILILTSTSTASSR